ncbi:phosphate acyltransferase PlsX [Syntrophomonas erecta]
MKVAIDAMGGDHGPSEVVAGALEWIEENDAGVILVGKEEIIAQELASYQYDPSRVAIVNTTQIINMDESPVSALRKKKDSSIVVATTMVKEGKADAVLSCGSTGAQMAASIFILGRMEGIERPPVVAAIPNIKGQDILLIDAGANVDCKPRQLVQFAILGSTYARIFGIEKPRVALLNNGEESTKGNVLSVEVYKLMQEYNKINFIGNLEGRNIFDGRADVLVCDGFVGNVVLKTVEGMALYIARGVSRELGMMPGFFKKLDYAQVGGAPLLGVKGVSIVCHGSSKRGAIYNGLNIARQCIDKGIVQLQEEALADVLG